MIGELEQRNNFELVKAMHTVVTYLNNEDEVEPWFFAYPDGADDDELMEIAGDEESMDYICSNFRRRMLRAAKEGWFTQPYSEFHESFERRAQGLQEPNHLYGAVKED